MGPFSILLSWYRRSLPWVKRPGRVVNPTPLSSDEITNGRIYTFTHTSNLRRMDRQNLPAPDITLNQFLLARIYIRSFIHTCVGQSIRWLAWWLDVWRLGIRFPTGIVFIFLLPLPPVRFWGLFILLSAEYLELFFIFVKLWGRDVDQSSSSVPRWIRGGLRLLRRASLWHNA